MFNVSIVRIKYTRSTIGYSEVRQQDQRLDAAFIAFNSLLTKMDDRLGKMEEHHSLCTKMDDRLGKLEEHHADSMATLTKMDNHLGKMEEHHADLMAKMEDCHADLMAKLDTRHVTSLSQMEERLLAKIDAFHDKFGNICTDVNDHKRHLVALKSAVTDHDTRISTLTFDLLIQESVLKGYKDTNNTTVATLCADVNDPCAKFPELCREIQKSTAGLAHDLRQQQRTPVNSETAPTTPPPSSGCFSQSPPYSRYDPLQFAWRLESHFSRGGFFSLWQLSSP